jgi:hypothetical protein
MLMLQGLGAWVCVKKIAGFQGLPQEMLLIYSGSAYGSTPFSHAELCW